MIFDELGFAIESGTVTVYNFSPDTKEYTGTTEEYVCEGCTIPANSTLVKAIEEKDGFTIIFTGEGWEYEEIKQEDKGDEVVKENKEVEAIKGENRDLGLAIDDLLRAYTVASLNDNKELMASLKEEYKALLAGETAEEDDEAEVEENTEEIVEAVEEDTEVAEGE